MADYASKNPMGQRKAPVSTPTLPVHEQDRTPEFQPELTRKSRGMIRFEGVRVMPADRFGLYNSAHGFGMPDNVLVMSSSVGDSDEFIGLRDFCGSRCQSIAGAIWKRARARLALNGQSTRLRFRPGEQPKPLRMRSGQARSVPPRTKSPTRSHRTASQLPHTSVRSRLQA